MTKSLRRAAWRFGLLVLLAGLSGCGIIGSLYTIAVDPLVPKTPDPAEYLFDGHKVLVWVEDVSFEEKNPLLRRALTQRILEEMRARELAVELIDYPAISQYRQTHLDHGSRAAARIGRDLGADQVIDITVASFRLKHEAGAGYYRTSLSGSYRVIDAAEGQRVWPEAEAQRPLSFTGQLTEGKGQAFEDRLVRQLCDEVATAIVYPFYPHPKQSL